MAIYVTSDWHLGHNRDFIYQARGFRSIEEMNREILQRYNSVVTDDDHVFVLGDLLLGDNSSIRYVEQMHGNIHIIRGNHDTEKRLELYNTLPNVVEIAEAKHFKYKKYHIFFCHYPTLTANYTDEKRFTSRLINLCGHTHAKDRLCDMDKGIIYHCEVDAHNCYPILLDNIIEEIKEEYQKRVDIK